MKMMIVMMIVMMMVVMIKQEVVGCVFEFDADASTWLRLLG